MRTVPVMFDDETYTRLLTLAHQRGLAVEQLVQDAVSSLYRQETDPGDISDSDFEGLIDEMVDAYRPVFHRLSQ